MAKTAQIPPIRVEPELYDELQQIADRSLASMSAHVRQAIVEYVARERGEVGEATIVGESHAFGVGRVPA